MFVVCNHNINDNKSGQTYHAYLLRIHVPLVGCTYLIFTCMLGVSYGRWFESLLLCSSYIFWALINILCLLKYVTHFILSILVLLRNLDCPRKFMYVCFEPEKQADTEVIHLGKMTENIVCTPTWIIPSLTYLCHLVQSTKQIAL